MQAVFKNYMHIASRASLHYFEVRGGFTLDCLSDVSPDVGMEQSYDFSFAWRSLIHPVWPLRGTGGTGDSPHVSTYSTSNSGTRSKLASTPATTLFGCLSE